MSTDLMDHSQREHWLATPFEISHPWRVETMVIGRTAAFRVPNPLRFTSREAADATRRYLMAEVYATSPDVVVRVEGPEALA